MVEPWHSGGEAVVRLSFPNSQALGEHPEVAC